jgi:hypothetical protein
VLLPVDGPDGSPLQHLRQIRAPRRASVIPTDRCFLRAVGSDLIQPINDLAVAAPVSNQALHLIATRATTLVARHLKVIELADKVTEYDCAVTWHCASEYRSEQGSGDPALFNCVVLCRKCHRQAPCMTGSHLQI